jgi:hypothetical protein
MRRPYRSGQPSPVSMAGGIHRRRCRRRIGIPGVTPFYMELHDAPMNAAYDDILSLSLPSPSVLPHPTRLFSLPCPSVLFHGGAHLRGDRAIVSECLR